jgi:NitT/TauT family transport system substrate-binding protein
MAGQPKTPFYVALGAVVIGLVVVAVWRSDIFAPKAPSEGGGANELLSLPAAQHVEEPAGAGAVTTVKEYTFKPAEKLPEVKGTSAYKPLQDNTVRFALNVWAGWAPIILANDGVKAGKVWKTPDGQEFKVELILMDNPVVMRNAYATGEVHIGWATLDMVPLFLEGFVDSSGKPRDSRVMPRIFQQVDWSNGGDGIVVRESIKPQGVGGLRGKKLVLAQNSPSHYFALNMLVHGGVQPSEVQMIFTDDAFQAAAAFNSNKDIAGAVSWAPDIYNLEKVKGNSMLVTTQEANKLIADVWFARADFAKDHADICEGLVRGIFDGMVALKDEASRKKVSELMATGYNISASDALGMLGDAHSTNWAENYQFFLNENNPTNFERVWNNAYRLYRGIRTITHQPVPFNQVMDFSIIERLGKEEKYASQKDEYRIQFAPAAASKIEVENEILTNTVYIHFFPNSWNLHEKITKKVDGKEVEEMYDPNVDNVLEEIGKLAGQFGAARIVIEGHADSSKRAEAAGVPGLGLEVKKLSERRANAVKQALVEKFKLDPNQFSVSGKGWDRPADPGDPMNQDKNRRVEVKVYPAEKPT